MEAINEGQQPKQPQDELNLSLRLRLMPSEGQDNAMASQMKCIKSRRRRKQTPPTLSSARTLATILFQLLLLSLISSELQDRGIISPITAELTPRILLAGAANECSSNDDCGSSKFCHENKCICPKESPIEDQDRCLNLALINEVCSLDEQCLGNSRCLGGVCSCGTDAIIIFNPSTKIDYCHPKRKLNEECNHDSQCPDNSFCSTGKNGCLCQNGYGPLNVRDDLTGVEIMACLPKKCSASSDCESEYHKCDENKCRCVADHFDPTTASCYKFGGTGGKSASNETIEKVQGFPFQPFIDDLIDNSDKMWIVIMILILLTLLVFLIIFMLLRKHYLGYCWTAHKKEYEPNNAHKHLNARNGQFDKDSINNKSFRRKNGDLEECDNNDDDETAGLTPRTDGGSRLTGGRLPMNQSSSKAHVKLDMNGKKSIDDRDNSRSPQSRQSQQQSDHVVSPLASSTSTPV